MAMCQYSYFRAIELSNAATATTLQYTGPALVLIWLALREKRMPARKEMIAVVCAMGGAYLLATHGDPSQLALSPTALVWCVLAAISVAVYSVQPRGDDCKIRYAAGYRLRYAAGGTWSVHYFPALACGRAVDAVTVLGMAYIIYFWHDLRFLLLSRGRAADRRGQGQHFGGDRAGGFHGAECFLAGRAAGAVWILQASC